MAVGTVAGPTFAAPKIVLRGPLNIVDDDQIEEAILVVVKPSRAGRPSPIVGHTGLGGYVSESSIAVVVVKDGALIAGHVQTGVAVLVEVSDGDPLAIVSFATHACFVGDVGKRSIAVVVVERGAQGLWRFVNGGGGRWHEEEIHQPVLVRVEPTDAGAHSFKVVLFFRGGAILKKSDSGRWPHVGIPDGYRRVLFPRSLPSEGGPLHGYADYGAECQDCTALGSESEAAPRFRFCPHARIARIALAQSGAMTLPAFSIVSTRTRILAHVGGVRGFDPRAIVPVGGAVVEQRWTWVR